MMGLLRWLNTQRQSLVLWRWWFAGAISMVVVLIVFSLIKITGLPVHVHGGDKILHTTAYGALVLAWMQIFITSRVDGLIVLGAFLLGVSLEFAQSFHPLRHMDYYDVIANGVGITVGYILGLFGLRKFIAWFEQVVLKLEQPQSE